MVTAPEFAMAYLGKAWVFGIANDPGLMTKAAALVETARGFTLNEREEAHLAALSHLVQGGRAAAVAVLDRHLMRYPFDLVAHQGAALTDGFLGRFHRVRDRSARALPLWSKDQPGYGSLLAFHAFGLEEAGDYARAENEDMLFPRRPQLLSFGFKGPFETRHVNGNRVASAFYCCDLGASAEKGRRFCAGRANTDKVIQERTGGPAVVSNEHYIGSADLVRFADIQTVITSNRWVERVTFEQKHLIVIYRQSAETGSSPLREGAGAGNQ